MITIEFNELYANMPFASVVASDVPRQYELVKIADRSYQVENVTWVLDNHKKPQGEKAMRAIVELKRL